MPVDPTKTRWLLIALAFLFALSIEVPPAAAAPRGYVCGPNGCYPAAKAQAVRRAPVKVKGLWQRLFNR